jgi:hypothetical protein
MALQPETEPDTEGKENRFTLEGVVGEVHEHSVELVVRNIELEEGRATGLLSEGDVERIYDQHRVDGENAECGDMKMAGGEFDLAGSAIGLTDIAEGTRIQVEGRVLDHCSAEGWKTRAVYDRLEIVRG